MNRVYGFYKHTLNWMESYLNNRTQMVEVSNKISSRQIISTGTPQGSRLSPLLFVILMADLNSWMDSILSNFANDTQSVIISENREELIKATTKEAKNVIDFFRYNNLVNNLDKAAVLYNCNGKGSDITFDKI